MKEIHLEACKLSKITRKQFLHAFFLAHSQMPDGPPMSSMSTDHQSFTPGPYTLYCTIINVSTQIILISGGR